MEENYLTEGSFKASIDSLIDSKFGEGYTLQDVGELVELTEMTLEDRMELMTKTIDKDFEDMSKSLDNLQKSLYDMLDLLTDSQVDLKDSAEHGGITDADIQKIVDGLKLEEKFFPHLYQYLDERFGLNEEKIKKFRSRTEKVIDADLGEVPVGDEREGRTESTAKINRELDKDRDKKAGKKAFEDQAVFNTRLKLWTEGHKEPSKQGGDEDKKDKRSDDESILSKIVKIGMIAGMIVEILKNSPELLNTIKDIFTGENGLLPKLQQVFKDLNLGESISEGFKSSFKLIKDWFRETFPGVYDMLTKIYNFVEGTYYAMMTPQEQDAYIQAHPESNLATWHKLGGEHMGLADVGQYSKVFSGKSGELLEQWTSEPGKAERLVASEGVDIEKFANAYSGGASLMQLMTHYLHKVQNGSMQSSDFIDWLDSLDTDSFYIDFLKDPTAVMQDLRARVTGDTSFYDGIRFFEKFGLQWENEMSAIPGVRNGVYVKNLKAAIANYKNSLSYKKSSSDASNSTDLSKKNASFEEALQKGISKRTDTSMDARSEEEKFVYTQRQQGKSDEEIRAKWELEQQKNLYEAPKPRLNTDFLFGATGSDKVHDGTNIVHITIQNNTTVSKPAVGNGSSVYNASV